jgi:hypothetical protein
MHALQQVPIWLAESRATFLEMGGRYALTAEARALLRHAQLLQHKRVVKRHFFQVVVTA